jgi:hypothetical protein
MVRRRLSLLNYKDKQMQSSRLGKLVRTLALATMLSLSLTACQTTGSDAINAGAGRPAVACQSFQPIYWSKQDTRPTQDQIVEHNAVYKRICNGKGK